MPLYRRATAELRRIHREADWVMTGVVLDGTWHPVDPAIGPPTTRLMEADLVDVVDFAAPAVLAPDIRSAVRVVVAMARDFGFTPADDAPRKAVLRGARAHEVKLRD